MSDQPQTDRPPPAAARGQPVRCARCGATLGHATAAGLDLGTAVLAETRVLRCAACGAARKWRFTQPALPPSP